MFYLNLPHIKLIFSLFLTFIFFSFTGCNKPQQPGKGANFPISALSSGLSSTSSATIVPAFTISPSVINLKGAQAQLLTPSGGLAPYTFSLPNNSIGTLLNLQGTTTTYTAPTAITTASDIVVTITDSRSTTITATIHLYPPMQITGPPKSLTQNIRFDFPGPIGGKAPYSYNIFNAANGCNINSASGIFTTPATVATNFSVTVRVTDSLGQITDNTFQVKNPVTLIPSERSMGFNQSFDYIFLGGEAPYTFTRVSGADTIATISSVSSPGRVTSSLISTGVVTFRVTDFLGQTADGRVIVEPPLIIRPPTANIRDRDRLAISTTGGVPPYTYTLFPAKGHIDILGLFTPPSASEYIGPIEITVTDNLGAKAVSNVYVGITISPTNSLILQGTTKSFRPIGGQTPFTFSTTAGNTVGAINSNGVFTAKPAASGFTTVRVTDSLGQSAETTLTTASVLNLTAPKSDLKQLEAITLSASGGDSNYTFSKVQGPGSIVSSTGVFTAADTVTVKKSTVIRVVDGLGQTKELTVYTYPALGITPTSANLAQKTIPALPISSVDLTTSKGKPPYTYSLNNPVGAIVVSSNTVLAKYTAPDSITANQNVILTVTDGLSQTATVTLHLKVPVALAAVISQVKGKATQEIIASGGDENYTFSVIEGTSGGTLSALSPSNSSRRLFTAASNLSNNISSTIEVKDGLNQSATKTIIVFTPVNLAAANPNFILPGATEIFYATKGMPPYSYSVVEGLNGGEINSSSSKGVFTAKPAANVPSNILVKIRVTDNLGQIADSSLTVAGPLSFLRSRFSVVQGESIRWIDPVGGKPPYTPKIIQSNPAATYRGLESNHYVFKSQGTSSGEVTIKFTDNLAQTAEIPLDVLPKILPQPSSIELNHPTGMTIDSDGNIYIVDSFNHRIIKYSSWGSYLTVYGSKGSAPGQLDTPWSIAVAPSGDFYVSEYQNQRISIFDRNFIYKSSFGTPGSALGQLRFPKGIAFDSNSNLYVADAGNHRVQKFTSIGVPIAAFGREGSNPGEFYIPSSIFIEQNNIYVCDNSRVQKFTLQSNNTIIYAATLGIPGTSYIQPSGVIVKTDKFFVLDKAQNKIIKLKNDNTTVFSFGDYGTNYGQFKSPESFFRDNLGQTYVADSSNNRIQIFATMAPSPETTTTTSTMPPVPPVPPAPRSHLSVGEVLIAGQKLVPAGANSCNCSAIMQGDGNFVVYKGAIALWNTGSWQNPGAHFVFQTDSNLVVYKDSSPKWNSQTWGRGGLQLLMQGDCNLVLYGPTGYIWNSRTNQNGCQ